MTKNQISLNIGGNMPGAPLFTITLNKADENGQVKGTGSITQAVNPPLDLHTFLFGQLTEIVFGPGLQTRIELTGHEFATIMPPNPVNVKDIEIQYTAGHGTANYSFLRPNGVWDNVTDAPVEVVGRVLQPH